MTALAADTRLLFSHNKPDRFAALRAKHRDEAWGLRPLRSAVGTESPGCKYVLSAGRTLPERQIIGTMRIVFLRGLLFFLAQKPAVGKGTYDGPAQYCGEKVFPSDLLFPTTVEQNTGIGPERHFKQSGQ